MKLPTKTLERKLLTSYDQIIAVDEVGMGSLAGPVVVCAVALTKSFRPVAGLRDSKLLTPQQRETYAAELKKSTWLAYQISYCYPRTIDRVNIYQAARRAMRRAVMRLANSKYQIRNSKQISNTKIQNSKRLKFGILKTVVLVDGPTTIKKLPFPQIPVVKGDRTVFAIACASIIAKVHRDRMMTRYAKRFPQYGFDRHKGYGTPHHHAMLIQHGPCALHRKSFTLYT